MSSEGQLSPIDQAQQDYETAHAASMAEFVALQGQYGELLPEPAMDSYHNSTAFKNARDARDRLEALTGEAI